MFVQRGEKINVPPEYRHIGVVFQDYAVWPHMTVLENILYPMKKMRMNKVEMTEKARHALEQVRMVGYEKHLPSQLSGGQQQRVAIARALVSNDDVIVMDEPITNLDAKLREEMLEEIRIIQRDIGTTILYITHDQEAALQLCDKMAIMDREGNLCQIGHDEDIILTPANRFVFEFIGVSNFLPMIHKDGHTYISAGKEYLYDDCPADIFMTGKAMEMGIRPNDIVYDNSSSVRGDCEEFRFSRQRVYLFCHFRRPRTSCPGERAGSHETWKCGRGAGSGAQILAAPLL